MLQIQWELILAMDMENQRRMDPRGRTFRNPIIINLDPDEVTLVEELAVVQNLVPINDTPDGSD